MLPAFKSVWQHAQIVAPVVQTSSTIRNCLSAMEPRLVSPFPWSGR